MRFLVLALGLMAACKADDSDTETDTGERVDPDAVCTEPTEPPCVDAIIADLSLHDDKVSDGAVANTQDGDDWLTTVDASAGGAFSSHEHPWVYLAFTDEGAVRVDLTDEDALESMEWHVATRRFIIRVNSGVSGPSCVGVAPMSGQAYADLGPPGAVTWVHDDYYDDECELQGDDSGMGTASPDVALGGWWSSSGACVATTGLPHYIQLDDGRVLKFVVEAYYISGQQACNDSGTMGTGSGNHTWRWAWLDD